jgi:intracellular sulfur oxidation DsrE/DsrF family protein
MRPILFLLFLLLAGTTVAQQNPKVILHLQSADSLVHKSLVNQISNIKSELPDAQIELVCHGPGIEFLTKKNGRYATKLLRMNLSDVVFAGCEFTMKQRNYKKDDLVPSATTVPFGIVEILRKEQAGWLYVKMGF